MTANARSVQISSGYQVAIAAGGMDVQDAATITNPDTEITDTSRNTIKCRSSNVASFRMAYDVTGTVSANPVMKVFGRYQFPDDSYDDWQILENFAGAKSAIVLTNVSGDVTNATLRFTHPDRFENVYDLTGVSELIVGLEVALATVTGDADLAYLEVKTN